MRMDISQNLSALYKQLPTFMQWAYDLHLTESIEIV